MSGTPYDEDVSEEHLGAGGTAAGISVGVDGSASSLEALDWAVDQALAERRALTLVHALGDPSPTWTDLSAVDRRTANDELRALGRRILDEAASRAHRRAPQVRIHRVMEPVDPRHLLVEQSRRSTMVVLGSRGRGHLGSALLGSVSVAVARQAACPLVVHRPGAAGAVRRGVVVAADGTDESLPVLEFGYGQASRTRAPLTVLHCYWDVQPVPSAYYVVGMPVADPELERLQLAESLAGLDEQFPDVAACRELHHGVPEVELARASEHAALVVVGAHHRSRLQRMMFSSISVAILEHASCPVAVVPLTAPAYGSSSRHR